MCRVVSICFVLLAAASLSGCIQYLPKVVDDTAVRNVPVIESIDPSDIADNPGYDENNILWGGSVYTRKFNLNSATIEEYIDDILKNLERAWPYAVPKYQVRVIYGDNLNAHATENNVIFLSSGWLRASESEDEIAAVLAHELSHILLQHPSAKGLRHDTTQILDAISLLVPVVVFLCDLDLKKNGSTTSLVLGKGLDTYRNMAIAMFLGRAIYETKQSISDPYFTRMQEEEADFLAIDLLQRAGYNSFVFRDEIMDKLKAYRQHVELELARKEEEYKFAFETMYRQIETDLAHAKIGQAIDNLIATLSTQVTHEIKKYFDESRAEHFNPTVRQARIAEYMTQHYKKSRRVKKKTEQLQALLAQAKFDQLHDGNKKAESALDLLAHGQLDSAAAMGLDALRGPAKNCPYPWFSLGKIRAEQNRWKDVHENLEKAVSIGGCSPETYSTLSRLHLQRQDLQSARIALWKGMSAFNEDPGPFYLDLAQLWRAQNNPMMFDRVLNECVSYPDRMIAQPCQAIIQQNSKDAPAAKKAASRNDSDTLFEAGKLLLKILR